MEGLELLLGTGLCLCRHTLACCFGVLQSKNKIRRKTAFLITVSLQIISKDLLKWEGMYLLYSYWSLSVTHMRTINRIPPQRTHDEMQSYTWIRQEHEIRGWSNIWEGPIITWFNSVYGPHVPVCTPYNIWACSPWEDRWSPPRHWLRRRSADHTVLTILEESRRNQGSLHQLTVCCWVWGSPISNRTLGTQHGGGGSRQQKSGYSMSRPSCVTSHEENLGGGHDVAEATLRAARGSSGLRSPLEDVSLCHVECVCDSMGQNSCLHKGSLEVSSWRSCPTWADLWAANTTTG